MEIKTIFKTMAMAVVCLSAVALVSCSDDDDNGSSSSSMKVSATKVEVAVDSTQTVSVTNCTTPLTVKSGDESIATVAADNTTLTIKGVKAGTANVVVTDAKNQTATITVTVKELLSFDKTAVSLSAGAEESISVKSGTAPYTVAVKDQSIATATVSDAAIIIKGIKAGSTTLTVTDKNNVTGVVNITVTK